MRLAFEAFYLKIFVLGRELVPLCQMLGNFRHDLTLISTILLEANVSACELN